MIRGLNKFVMISRKNEKLKLYIPKYPKIIIDTLMKYGFDAYIVGGCVRDELLGVAPSDFDITTDAKPTDIKKLFKRTFDTGIKHGTVSVVFYELGKPQVFEVTTYRIDGEYDDARHPKDVTFVSDLREDLRRRDFTVNAMAYNTNVGLVDEFSGLKDLDDKIIRSVGNPVERFTEDALRLLRAIRFAAKLGFSIENETKNAIPKLAKNLSLISKERVQVELTKILTSKNPNYVDLVFELGLSKYICKFFDTIKRGHIEKNLNIHLAYASLLYNTKIDLSNSILKELKLDNNTINKVTMLLNAKSYYDRIYNLYIKLKRTNERITTKIDKNTDSLSDDKISSEIEVIIKESIDYLKYDLIYDFIKLLSSNTHDMELISYYEKIVKKFEIQKVPIFIKDLDIDGKDIMDIGFKNAEVGVALKNLQKIVHKVPKINQKKLLQEIAKKAYNIYNNRSI